MKKVHKAISLILSIAMTASFSGCLLEELDSSKSSQSHSNSDFKESVSGSSSELEDDESIDSSKDAGEESSKDSSEDPKEDSTQDSSQNSSEDSSQDSSEDPKQEEEAVVGSVAWYLQNGYKTLFGDPYIKNGIHILAVDGTAGKTIGFGSSQGAASWTFAQWHSRYDLRNYESLKYKDKGTAFELASYGAKNSDGQYIPAKILKIDTKIPSIYMELNAELEFDKPKEDGEGWPHTLLSQDFSGNLVHVCEQKEIKAHMEYAVTKFVDRMNGQADASRHCAQLVWYVTLQNRNPESDGFGQYIWFGFNLWDNRHSGGVCPEYAAQDLGKEDATKAFIYQPASTVFFDEKRMPTVGEQTKIEFDFLPLAKQAFELAKSRGYLPQTTWEDIYIGSMNFGWEVTGIYNVGVQIDTVGIYYK